MKTFPVLLAVIGLCAGAGVAADPHAEHGKMSAEQKQAHHQDMLREVLAGSWRSDTNKARDQYRHPLETLEFFGITPHSKVLEIWPGGGWYAEILAPYATVHGSYTAAVNDPLKMSSERSKEYYAQQNQALRQKFTDNPAVFGKARIVEFDPAQPVLGMDGSLDAVLTFRNVHNWRGNGQAEGMFKAFYNVLRQGGTLGVVEHRANADVPTDDKSGYVSQAQVIALAEQAGFKLVAQSEINANPKDTKDYPGGVWTLPPVLREGDSNREKYLAIGESDRMTLKFVKP